MFITKLVYVKTEMVSFCFLISHKNNNMFSTGQLIFAICFAVVFISAIIYTYKKDLKLHKLHYKGTIWVLIAFISFIGLIAAIKFIFK